MAKRRRLDIPDSTALERLARDFAAEPLVALPLGPSAPPIARVAAETAGQAAAATIDARIKAATYEADAARWREAEAEGRVAVLLPLGAIETEHLARDRLSLDEDEMAELRNSIRTHGLRLPVEVMRVDGPPGAQPHYGLISGWRRLQALRTLWAETGDEVFSTVKALVRTPVDAAEAYVAMVEENEIRADLSHYERGRIAVVAAGQGAFSSVDAAVSVLFAASSKAKRSKIRSFAHIYEELGDLLAFGTALSERSGLRLAAALRLGAGSQLRRTLARRSPETAAEEWAAIEGILVETERQLAEGDAGRRSGRPRRGGGEHSAGRVMLANGLMMEQVVGDGYVALRFRGRTADGQLLQTISREIERLLTSSA